LFRVFGIRLALHSTFVLLLVYVAWEGWQEAGWPGVGWSVAFTVLLFTCIVMHELGHSLTARRFGIGVRRILLMPIGGMAEFDSIPRQPSRELLITLAGPAVNFVLAALLWAVVPFPAGWTPTALPYSLAELGREIVLVNLVMGVFNLVPVFPMDGGRILRALLTRKMDFVRATDVAVRVSRVTAVAFGVLGLLGAWELLFLAPYLWILASRERLLARIMADHYVYGRAGYAERRVGDVEVLGRGAWERRGWL
jgi:Zn-dependent protease